MTEPDRLDVDKSLTPNLDNALSHPNTCGYGVFTDAARELRRLKDRLADRDALDEELKRSRAEVDRLQKLIANDGGWTVPRQLLEESRAEQSEPPPKVRGKKALARLLEALTPSGATKAAYMGEFRFSFCHGFDEDGNDVVIDVQVPWTTIKAVMAAIVKRASVSTIDLPDGAANEIASIVNGLGETCNACHAPYSEHACGPTHALIAHERAQIRNDGGNPPAGEGGDRG